MTWEDYLDGKFFMKVSPREAGEFLRRCEDEGIRWRSGHKPTEKLDYFSVYHRPRNVAVEFQNRLHITDRMSGLTVSYEDFKAQETAASSDFSGLLDVIMNGGN